MRKIILLIIVSVLINTLVFSESCLPDGITFTLQSQIDNFQSNYENCHRIEGDVIISGYNIINLYGLSVLDTIGGVLNIRENPLLQSTDGLNNLIYTGGLIVYDNPLLENIDGFENIVETGRVNIKKNHQLLNIESLVSLYQVNGDFEISQNYVLESLQGLESLTTINGGAFISLYPTEYLGGLSSLKRIEDYFELSGLSLKSLEGLETLSYIGGDFWMYQTDSLVNMNGLNSLDTIVGELRFTNNYSLENLYGMNSLVWIGGDVISGQNPAFTKLWNASSVTYIGGDFIISNLEDFSGTESLTNVGGDFIIRDCQSLNGLEGLLNVGGKLALDCAELTSLSPLGSLTSIGDAISISGCKISDLSDLESLSYIGGGVGLSNTFIISLHGLEFLTDISGRLTLSGNSYLKNLNGLENVKSIGSILFSENDSLVDISSLNLLSSIGGTFEISENPKLASLDGLNQITSLPETVFITSNNSLESLSGLENVSTIGGHLRINENPRLMNLDGLISLENLEGVLYIERNDTLMNLHGLISLNSINGHHLYVRENQNLTSLSGLNSINPFSINSLFIQNNISLASCHVRSICKYLATPNGDIYINGNAPGCNDQQEIDSACQEITYPGDLLVSSQSEIDSFYFQYPAYTIIGGNLSIEGADIVDLRGLKWLTSIGGNLSIINNPILSNLSGIENIEAESVENLFIYNNSSLTVCEISNICDYLASPIGVVDIHDNALGCNSQEEIDTACHNISFDGNMVLSSQAAIDDFQYNYPTCSQIDGDLTIQGTDIYDLQDLEVLTAINGDLSIIENPLLTNLSGIDNIDYTTINNLFIYDNPLLSTCNIECICDFIYSGSGIIEIYSNLIDCNSIEEIEFLCPIGISENNSTRSELVVFPNPGNGKISFTLFHHEEVINEIRIYNHLGQAVSQGKPSGNSYNISEIQAGMYILHIKTQFTDYRNKLIVK